MRSARKIPRRPGFGLGYLDIYAWVFDVELQEAWVGDDGKGRSFVEASGDVAARCLAQDGGAVGMVCGTRERMFPPQTVRRCLRWGSRGGLVWGGRSSFARYPTLCAMRLRKGWGTRICGGLWLMLVSETF
jgi:hypothetical protein